MIAHDGAREAVLIALQMPAPIGKQLIQYVALFRPAKRDLSLDRLADLLGELLGMIKAAVITYDGRVWPAPVEIWPAALKEILDRDAKKPLERPLKNHNYLLVIIKGLANKAAARAEARVEEQRRVAPGRKSSNPAAVGQHLANLKNAVGRGLAEDPHPNPSPSGRGAKTGD